MTMPIRESEKHRYPAREEWIAIRRAILDRANNCCECRGECGNAHDDRLDDLNWCEAPNGRLLVRDLDDPRLWVDAELAEGLPGYSNPFRLVLTIAHLDHQPENNDPENLRAWCQRCHLLHDAKLHARNAAATRRSRKAVGELPGVER